MKAPEIDRYVLFRQGRALEGYVRWAEAEATYRQLLTEQPRHSGLLLRLSAVQHQQSKTQEALAALDTVLAMIQAWPAPTPTAAPCCNWPATSMERRRLCARP